MFDVEIKIRTIPKVLDNSKNELLKVIDSWSISNLKGMWKGKEEDSIEITIICDIDKSKEIVSIIANNAKKLGEESIMIGNSFLSLNQLA
jgi:hypothetical protein